MKFSQGFSKRLLSLMLASLMLFMLSVTAFADLWIAPTDAYYKKDVYYLLDEASGRRKMNLFLSNFSEASLKTFDSKTTSDKDILNFLFKHFELNASLYSGVIIKDDGNSGKIMTVTDENIEKAAKNMFNRTFTTHPVSGFSGYKDGNYIVTAEEAGSPLKVLSIASYIEYYGKNDYKVQFAIYKAETKIDDYYSYSSNEAAQTSALQKIGEGSANFNYIGGTGSSAFRLTSYFLDMLNTTEFIYTKPNKPISSGTTTTANVTTITQQTTAIKETTTLQKTTATQTTEISSTQTETLPVSETFAVSNESTTISDKAVINDSETGDILADKSDVNKTIILSVIVVLAAVAATIVIVLLFKKKK